MSVDCSDIQTPRGPDRASDARAWTGIGVRLEATDRIHYGDFDWPGL
jgi:hypothetical protein